MVGSLPEVVRDMAKKRPQILALAKKYGTPFYLVDDENLEDSISGFENAFREHIQESKFFYAIKANPYPHFLRRAVHHGWGLDASSGRELKLALDSRAKKILLTGPGKTEAELKLALKHFRNVILNIDNFSELARLGKLLRRKKIRIRAGVRIFSSIHGSWSKFGISLSDLQRFWQKSRSMPGLELQGIQFHTSLNLGPERYQQIIAELGKYLKTKFSAQMRSEIKFIDFGGGFFPDRVEGYYPWSHHYPWMFSGGEKPKPEARYYITRAASPEQYASGIGTAITKHLSPLGKHEYFGEPGRIVATRAMHIVLSVLDVKQNLAITDGGLNMMGWEFGKEFYLPIVNLTNFSDKEMRFTLYGSLCTPRDLWGHYIYAKKITEGDVIVIPNQGAYRFALAQEFIKPIPPVYILK